MQEFANAVQLEGSVESLARITSVIKKHGKYVFKVEAAGEMITVKKSASDEELKHTTMGTVADTESLPAGVNEKLLPFDPAQKGWQDNESFHVQSVEGEMACPDTKNDEADGYDDKSHRVDVQSMKVTAIGSAEEPTEACRDVARDSVEVIEISPIVVKAAAAEEPNETAGLQLE